MLVITRKVGEQIAIGDEIKLTVVRLIGNSVRLGVEAPPDMMVVREELSDRTVQTAHGVAEAGKEATR